jgi:hypothetical protein
VRRSQPTERFEREDLEWERDIYSKMLVLKAYSWKFKIGGDRVADTTPQREKTREHDKDKKLEFFYCQKARE